MPAAAGALLKRYLRTAAVYLEYGSGGSTVVAAGLCPCVISVDSDSRFLDAVTAKVQATNAACRFYPVYADIGRTGKYGKPLLRFLPSEKWQRYPASPWEVLRRLGVMPSVVLIDGRFRVACALRVLLELPNDAGAAILFDDFSNRPYYRIVLDFADEVERAGRLVVLRKRKNFDDFRGRVLSRRYERDWR